MSKEQILSTRRYDLSGNGEKLLIVAHPAVPADYTKTWFGVFFVFWGFFLLLFIIECYVSFRYTHMDSTNLFIVQCSSQMKTPSAFFFFL